MRCRTAPFCTVATAVACVGGGSEFWWPTDSAGRIRRTWLMAEVLPVLWGKDDGRAHAQSVALCRRLAGTTQWSR